MSVGCSGRGQLLTLAGFDSISHRWLTGDALYAGLYLNELLLRLLRDDDPHPVLFAGYERALECLTDSADEAALRIFERLVLKECGYEVTFGFDAETGEAVQSGRSYRFLPDVGFHAVDEAVDDRLVFGGATLHAIATDDYAQDTRAARRETDHATRAGAASRRPADRQPGAVPKNSAS